jgi:NAD(P)-dependent dehydrogenase (short-subunit alcohol dehydrogenase family)
VAVLDIIKQSADETVREMTDHGGSAAAFLCDVAQWTDVQATFHAVQERFGHLDALVNNAGVAHIGTVETTTDEDFDRIFAVNVKGVFHGMKAAVATMKDRGGVILNIASVVASIGIPERFAYTMSKGAVLTMTYSVARDYVDRKIRCNSVSPARVHTPFVDGYLARNYPGREAEMFEKLARTQPIGRMGTPDEVAALALFLCSDEAAFITGSNFPIDGGFLTLK